MTPRPPPDATASDALAALIHSAGRRTEPPAEHRNAALAAATRSWERVVARRRTRRLAFAIAAGVALFAVGPTLLRELRWPAVTLARADRVAGTVLVRTGSGDSWSTLRPGTAAIAQGTALQTAAAAGAGIVFRSGASLRLAERTQVLVTTAHEVLLLAGTVYVDSGAGTSGALAVVTAAATARDIGTQFEVRYEDVSHAYRLRVREGRVILQRGQVDRVAQAGEQYELQVDGSQGAHFSAPAPIARDAAEWTWVQALAPVPEIDGQPITVLLEWAARETGRNLDYATPAVASHAAGTRLRGSIRGLTPLEALDIMLATTDLEYFVRDGMITVRLQEPRETGT